MCFANYIRESLECALYEELSVNNEVRRFAEKLVGEIIDEISHHASTRTEVHGVSKAVFRLNSKFLGKDVVTNVIFLNFHNKKAFDGNKDLFQFNYASCVSSGKKFHLIVYCYGISGSLKINELADSTQHEVERIYQMIKTKKPLMLPNRLYAIASQDLASTDEAERNIATLLYYSFDFEQDGYVNGLYAWLKANDEYPLWDNIKESPACQGLAELRSSIAWITQNKECLGQKANKYSLTVGQLLKIGIAAEKRFVSKIGKVLAKVRIESGIIPTIGKDGKNHNIF